jgi:hypothetical protein
MIAIYFVYYNFCRAHQALHMTPKLKAAGWDIVHSLR